MLRRPYHLIQYSTKINRPALTAMLKHIIANNRAGGCRKAKGTRTTADDQATPLTALPDRRPLRAAGGR